MEPKFAIDSIDFEVSVSFSVCTKNPYNRKNMKASDTQTGYADFNDAVEAARLAIARVTAKSIELSDAQIKVFRLEANAAEKKKVGE